MNALALIVETLAELIIMLLALFFLTPVGWIILVWLLLSSAHASCPEVEPPYWGIGMTRCEEQDAVCYVTSRGGIGCIPKPAPSPTPAKPRMKKFRFTPIPVRQAPEEQKKIGGWDD